VRRVQHLQLAGFAQLRACTAEQTVWSDCIDAVSVPCLLCSPDGVTQWGCPGGGELCNISALGRLLTGVSGGVVSKVGRVASIIYASSSHKQHSHFEQVFMSCGCLAAGL
jgi:hypothetical protein